MLVKISIKYVLRLVLLHTCDCYNYIWLKVIWLYLNNRYYILYTHMHVVTLKIQQNDAILHVITIINNMFRCLFSYQE